MCSVFKNCFTLLSQIKNVQVIPKRSLLKHSINHIISKKAIDKYLRLPCPCNKVLATYIWIDGSGINLRSKDRILNCTPYSPDVAPQWYFDGSSCGLADTQTSDTRLMPAAVCRDPFRMEPHVLIMCEAYKADTQNPVVTNHRKYCNELCETWRDEEPWFGIEQEYTLLDNDGWGLGWPKGGGFPFVKYEFCYCGVGSKYICARDLIECHTRACLYAGLDFEGTNAEVMFACWEWQIGTSVGIKGADDLWLSRYIMSRVGEEYGVQATYHPKPFGQYHPGIGMHHNFSTNSTRSDGGLKVIEGYLKKMGDNHMKHMKHYGAEEATNRQRLSGKFETSPFDKFSWGVANRKTSIRLQRSTVKKGKGYLEDRRPAGDADPYMVCGLLMETCMGKEGSGSCSKQC